MTQMASTALARRLFEQSVGLSLERQETPGSCVAVAVVAPRRVEWHCFQIFQNEIQFISPNFRAQTLTLTAESFELLWRALQEKFPNACVALLCDVKTFRGLCHAQDTMMFLAGIGHAHAYFMRASA